MPLPEDLTVVTITFGESQPYTDAAGEIDAVGMTGKLVPIHPTTFKPLRLVHADTGGAILPSPVVVAIGSDGRATLGPVPHTDNPLLVYIDSDGLTKYGFLYELTWDVASSKPSPGNKRFAAPSTAGASVDFDLLSTSPAVEGVVVPVIGGGGGGGSTTDASDLTSGTLAVARIANGSLTAAKMAADVATQAELDAVAAAKAPVSHTHGVADLTATGTKDATTFLRGDNTWAVPAGGGGDGVSDHGALTGLADDDHPQYLNSTRGDARYYTKSQLALSVKDYGAKGDGRVVKDAAVTNTSTTVTSATAAFTSTDVGRRIAIRDYAGKRAHGSTIASVTNATTVVMADACTFTVTGASATIATDDTAAFTAALAALSPAATAKGGGTLFVPSGIYGIVGGGLGVDTLIANGTIVVRGEGLDYTMLDGTVSAPRLGTVIRAMNRMESILVLGSDSTSSESGQTSSGAENVCFDGYGLARFPLVTAGRRNYVVGCMAWDGTGAAFNMRGQNGYLIRCIIGQNATGHCVYIQSDDNHVFDNQIRNGINQIYVAGGYNNTQILGNHMWSGGNGAVGSPISVGVRLSGAITTLISGNSFDTEGDAHVLLESGAYACTITGNTIFSLSTPPNDAIRIDNTGSACRAITVTGNAVRGGDAAQPIPSIVRAVGAATKALVISGNTGVNISQVLIGTADQLGPNSIVTPAGAVKNTRSEGRATFSGDGTATVFTIAHGLDAYPARALLSPASAAAAQPRWHSADGTNITVTFLTAPPSGTGNVVIDWEAVSGGVGSATAPGQVTGLAASPGDTQVALTWTAPSNGGSPLTDYLVEYKLTSSGSWSTFSDGTSTTTAVTVTGLTNGSSYDFRVSAVNAVGTGTASATVSSTPAAPVPPSGAVQDSFNRADSGTGLGTADVGGPWTAAAGTFGIATNQARAVSAGAPDLAVIDTGLTNLTVSVKINTLASPSTAAAGIMARYVDANNYIWADVTGAGSIRLFKRVSGTNTSLGSPVAGFAAGLTLTMTVTGNNIVVTRSNTSGGGTTTAFNVTDAAIPTGTKVGFRSSGDTAARYDDFAAG